MDSAAITRAGEQLGRAVELMDAVARTDVPRRFGRYKALAAARWSLGDAVALTSTAPRTLELDDPANPVNQTITGFLSTISNAIEGKDPVKIAGSAAAQDARAGARTLSALLTNASSESPDAIGRYAEVVGSGRIGSVRPALDAALAGPPTDTAAHTIAVLGAVSPNEVFGRTASTRWSRGLLSALASATDTTASPLIDSVRSLSNGHDERSAISAEFTAALRRGAVGRFANFSDFATLPHDLQPDRLHDALQANATTLRQMAIEADVADLTKDGNTREGYTHVLRDIVAKPVQALTDDDMRLGAAIVNLPDDVRPELPAPLDPTYTLAAIFANRWKHLAGAQTELANSRFQLDLQLSALQDHKTKAQYTQELLDIVSKGTTLMTDDDFRRSAAIMTLPRDVRPDLPAPLSRGRRPVYDFMSNARSMSRVRGSAIAREYDNIAAHLIWNVGDPDTKLATAPDALRQAMIVPPNMARVTIDGIMRLLRKLPVGTNARQVSIRDTAVEHLERALSRIDGRNPYGYLFVPDTSDIGQAASGIDVLRQLRTMDASPAVADNDAVNW